MFTIWFSPVITNFWHNKEAEKQPENSVFGLFALLTHLGKCSKLQGEAVGF